MTALAAASPLIAGGYLDTDGLAGTAVPADHDTCRVFAIEATLRSYGHAGSPAPVAATAGAPA